MMFSYLGIDAIYGEDMALFIVVLEATALYQLLVAQVFLGTIFERNASTPT